MTIDALWQEHSDARFSKGRGLEMDEFVRLDLLDGWIAGCVSTFLKRGRTLDVWGTAILGLCYAELISVLPRLAGDDRVYFDRLALMARLALEAVRDTARSNES